MDPLAAFHCVLCVRLLPFARALRDYLPAANFAIKSYG